MENFSTKVKEDIAHSTDVVEEEEKKELINTSD